MKNILIAAFVFAVGTTACSASGGVTILDTARSASVEFYRHSTGESTVVSTTSSLAVGPWTGLAGSASDVATHHSVVTAEFISADFHCPWNFYPLPEGDYATANGSAYLVTRFELTDPTTSVLMDNGLLDASLVRESPAPQTWQFPVFTRTLISGLTPGVYTYRAFSYPSSVGSGTLYIPSPASCVLLAAGLHPLLVRRRRSAT